MIIRASVKYIMTRVIKKKYNPTYLSIFNDSKDYINHRSIVNNTSNETHFTIYIKSARFNGVTKFDRVKEVQDMLKFAYNISVVRLFIFCYDSTEILPL